MNLKPEKPSIAGNPTGPRGIVFSFEDKRMEQTNIGTFREDQESTSSPRDFVLKQGLGVTFADSLARCLMTKGWESRKKELIAELNRLEQDTPRNGTWPG
jgi:hypothetical protein